MTETLIKGDTMAKKKSKKEASKLTSMMRMDQDVLKIARKAAALMGLSLSAYAANVLREAATRDLIREGRKLASGDKGD